jgi:hypothetical protein
MRKGTLGERSELAAEAEPTKAHTAPAILSVPLDFERTTTAEPPAISRRDLGEHFFNAFESRDFSMPWNGTHMSFFRRTPHPSWAFQLDREEIHGKL